MTRMNVVRPGRSGRSGARPARTGRGLARWLTPPLLMLAAGCTADAGPTATTTQDAVVPSPFAGCAALTAPPAGPAAGSTATGARATAGASDSAGRAGPGLPDLTLPCFTGQQPFRLADLRGPAVLNLWATSCGPCREELPAVQQLADRTAGTLHVVGVDTRDSRDAAASFGTDLRITFPNLYDREAKLLLAVGKPVLPMTIFVDATGRREIYNGPALDGAALARLVTRHTGVAVPS